MPVTFTVANNAARRWQFPKATTAEQLFEGVSYKDYNRSKRIIQSSFDQQMLHDQHISSCKNSLVESVHFAYSNHHHLILRPEDVWLTILSQLAFFINAHADELQSFMVSHRGQEQLEVISNASSTEDADFGAMVVHMTELMKKRIVDPELQSWILPDFSTTTVSDHVVAATLMMGGFQKYFSYRMTLRCGIPSVTLLGEKEDWEQLLHKLDRVPQLGIEPIKFATLVRPVLEGFIASFKDPTSSEVVSFWSKCTHETGGSGPHYLSGWITAFCFWNEEGQSLYHGHPTDRTSWRESADYQMGCELDGTLFHRVDTNDIPCGMVSVPVKLNDNTNIYNVNIMAGMVGGKATSSGQMSDGADDDINQRSLPRRPNEELLPHENTSTVPPEQAVLDSIQPVSGWWIYEPEDSGMEEARKAEKKAVDDEVVALGNVAQLDINGRLRLLDLWGRSEELAVF